MLEHVGTQILETDRLRLRPLENRDTADYFACFGDQEVTRYIHLATLQNMDAAREHLRQCLTQYRCRRDFYCWAIAHKADDRLLGILRLRVLDEESESADLFFALARPHWGCGLMREALKKVLRFGLQQVGFNRIEGEHAAGNPAAGAVMRGAGMLYEGMQREKRRNRLGYHDYNLYGILKKDL